MSIENTNCCENCAFVKAGLCKTDTGCPNYVESWWLEKDGVTPKMVKDCAPKRMIFMQQVEVHRMQAVQAALEQTRNECMLLQQELKTCLQQSIAYMEEKRIGELENKKQILIEQKENQNV